ncbi:MAG: helix-turn-helix domain-containing protein [Pseudomonadales bacterium]|nr:helix-turn-helix domain-containing protein [Pseudomonadales bacterium]
MFAALQAIFLIFVLLRAPTSNKVPNILLSLLLLCLALILVEHTWVYSGAFHISPRLSGFSMPGLIVLSPLYYFYANAFLQIKLGKKIFIHMLPSLAIILLSIPWVLANSERKVELLELSITTGLPFFSSHATLIATAIAVHMLVYFYATYLLVENYESKVKEGSADVGVLSVHWLTQLSFSFCVFAVLFYLSALGYLVMTSETNVLPNLFVYTIAGLIFLLAYLSYRQPDLFALYQPGNLPSVKELEEKPKYQNTALAPELLMHYKQLLLAKMEAEKPYLNGELRLAHLAESLTIPAHQLSQVVNVVFNVSFFDFINQYRVGYAKMLIHKEGTASNILDIAFQSGFNSKASFNRVFKRETGLTPSQFLANRSNSENTSFT